MNLSRSIWLSLFVLVGIALAPVHAHAGAPPRVLALTELAAKPVEVAISSKHLTLIHFETGDVSMVAVGDPAVVSVTVKGPDVLLKALASSGSTNAFIWQAGQYTQWVFTVRQTNKDPRVIIVKGSSAATKDESNARSGARGESDGKKAREPAPVAATSGQPGSGPTVGSTAPVPVQPSAEPPPQKPTNAPAGDACGKSPGLDQFVKTLNAWQRELFSVFLTEPTLARLQALLRELGLHQRCDLLALLSALDPSEHGANGSPQLKGTSALPSTNTQNRNQAEQQTAESHRGTEGQGAAETTPDQRRSSLPAGVTLTVTPQIVDGQVFLYYILENRGGETFLSDILRLRFFDRNGNRLAFSINRASQDAYIGRLEANGVEYGLIGINAPEKVLVLEWKLVTLGSGAPQLLQMEVQIP